MSAPEPPSATSSEPPPSTGRARSRAKRRVTLSDVAADAGVSTTAASFVLSGRENHRIPVATQERVRASAEKLGYRPNLTARSLRTGTSGTIALVSDYLSSTPYASDVLRGALEAARKQDMLLYIAESLGDRDVESRLLQGFMDRGVDAFIYATMFTRHVAVPELARSRPLVLLNCTEEEVDAPSVLPDEEGAGRSAADLLLSAGHRAGIHFLGALPPGQRGGTRWQEEVPLALAERLAGVQQALAGAGLALEPSPTLHEWEPADGRHAVEELLRTGHVPRALVCINDRVAFGAYQALQDAGLTVPSDVSVVSFDDSELAGWLRPGLTSIGLPHEAMGRAAVETLLDGAEHGRRQRLTMPVQPRESVSSPRP